MTRIAGLLRVRVTGEEYASFYLIFLISPSISCSPRLWLTALLCQCLKARQKLFVTLVHLAGRFVRGCGFRANQGLRAAAAVGDMREITAVAIDHLMQMLPTLLPHAETMHGLLGVGQECAQLATVATVAGQLGGAAIIRRFDRLLRDALLPTRTDKPPASARSRGGTWRTSHSTTIPRRRSRPRACR